MSDTWLWYGAGGSSVVMVVVLVTAVFSLFLMDFYGQEVDAGHLVPHSRLDGPYGHAWQGLNYVQLIVCSLYWLLHAAWVWRWWHHPLPVRGDLVLALVLWLVSAMGLVTASLNVHVALNWGELVQERQLVPNPVAPVPGENFQMRGPLGTAVWGLGLATALSAGLAQTATTVWTWSRVKGRWP